MKQIIKLKTIDGIVNIKAFVFGEFACHEKYLTGGYRNVKYKNYVITHIGSGMSVPKEFDRLSDVKNLCKK